MVEHPLHDDARSSSAAQLIVLALGLAFCGAPTGPVHDPGSVPRPRVLVTPAPLVGFMRGVNLGNALDAPHEGDWGVTLSEAHFEAAQALGLDHVRLPVRFSAHAAESAPYTIDPAFFARVDWAIARARAHGLSIIVDLHHYEELMKEPARHVDRVVGMWTQIASRYASMPPSVAFELVNEPNGALGPDLLDALHERALAAVRATNPTRLVICDGYFWAAADRLENLHLPDDPNVVASFHMYQPMLFTHQGADWMPPEYRTTGVVFPGPPASPIDPSTNNVKWVEKWFEGYNKLAVAENPSGPKTIFEQFAFADAYVAAHGKRVYLGELGVMDTADDRSRANWIRFVVREADRHGIGWALWDDGGHMQALDVGARDWTAPIKAALASK
jgi:endoglucanase